MNHGNDYFEFAADLARREGERVLGTADYRKAFGDAVKAFPTGTEDYRAGLHELAIKVLPRHLYQVWSFVYMRNAPVDVVARRMLISLDHMKRWCDEVALAVGAEIVRTGYAVPKN